MRKPFEPRCRSVAVGLLLMTVCSPAFAYLDPGTGSIVLQSLLAGIAVAIGIVRTYWYRVKAFFGAKPPESADSLAGPDGSPPDSSRGA